jgi:hypothetical protein
LLLPQVRWPIYGWLRGEVFYQGMPTSWWQSEIDQWYHPGACETSLLTIWFVDVRPSLWDQLRPHLNPRKGVAIPVMDAVSSSPLLDGDADALPMLLVLIRSEAAKVRRVAIGGLVAQGKERPGVMPALLEAINDPDTDVRQGAIVALKHLDPEAAAKAGVE